MRLGCKREEKESAVGVSVDLQDQLENPLLGCQWLVGTMVGARSLGGIQKHAESAAKALLCGHAARQSPHHSTERRRTRPEG
jgi:hypothetical protein